MMFKFRVTIAVVELYMYIIPSTHTHSEEKLIVIKVVINASALLGTANLFFFK